MRSKQAIGSIKTIFFLSIGLLLMVVGSLLLAGALYERAYAGRMFPGVSILGQPVGGATYATARALAEEKATALLDTPITLVYADGSEELITPRRLSLVLDPDQLTREAYARGRTGTLLSRWSEILLLQNSGAAFAFTPTFDTDLILAALEPSFVAHEKAPQDASLKFVDGNLVIMPEAAGIRIDRAQFSNLIEAAFTTLNVPERIVVPIETVTPKVASTDLESLLAEARRLTSTPLTLVARDRKFTVSTATLASWVVADSSRLPATLSWSTDKISSYLGTIARKVDVPMTPRKLNAQTGAVISEGEVGWKLDRAAAVDLILNALAARQAAPSLTDFSTETITLTVSELPIEEKAVTPPFTPGLYAGKYLEVNLSEQTLYQWEGTNMLASYPVSTGKWSTPTPEGVLYIKNHIAYAYSRKYNLYMPWWLGLAFNPDGSNYQGYGIHELPEWKGGIKEGQNHLGTPVSHGCIRLGIGPAETIYNWAEDGMPVYIHK